MPRRIVTAQLQSTAPHPSLDGFFDRVIKYIPGDVIGAWIAIKNLVATAQPAATPDTSAQVILWVTFTFLAAFTLYWTDRQTRQPNAPRATTQIWMSGVAFVLWAWATGEPFRSVVPYSDLLSSIALILFSLLSGRVIPSK